MLNNFKESDHIYEADISVLSKSVKSNSVKMYLSHRPGQPGKTKGQLIVFNPDEVQRLKNFLNSITLC